MTAYYVIYINDYFFLCQFENMTEFSSFIIIIINDFFIFIHCPPPPECRGVVWDKSNAKWKVGIYFDGKTKNIGYFDDTVTAALAYDAYAIDNKLDKPLNFPDDPAANDHIVTSSKTSQFRGVCWHKTSKKWVVEITDKGRKTYIGRFDDEVEAARAYDAHVVKKHIDTALNFQIDELDEEPRQELVEIGDMVRIMKTQGSQQQYKEQVGTIIEVLAHPYTRRFCFVSL